MLRLIMSLACAASLIACASYRVLHKTAAGGTVALAGDRARAMEDARAEMTAHCHGPFTIIEEGEQVAQGVASAAVEDSIEWRVTYVCGAEPSTGGGTEQGGMAQIESAPIRAAVPTHGASL